MIRGMYSAASALDATMQRQEVTAENLAHVTTPGYRGKGIAFESFDQVLADVGSSATPTVGGVQIGTIYNDFKLGSPRETGDTYHLALDNDAYFALQGPRGTVFTRNGSFHLGAGGKVVSDGGYPVLGAAGPIVIPEEGTQVVIARDGNVTVDGNSIGQLKLTRFSSPDKLVPVGPTLFEAPADAGEQPAVAGVHQGYLESANFSATDAMVEMIQSSRFFEMAQRALRAISESVQLNTRPGT